MFDKEKRQEKRERKDAVKATLKEEIKPRENFAQRQEKTARRKTRDEETDRINTMVTDQLKPALTGNGTGQVVQLGSDLLYTQGLSGIHLQIQDHVIGQEKVFTRWQVFGKHDRDFLGMAPTNRDVQFGGVSVSFIGEEKDKVTQEFHYWDMVALLQQIQAP